LVSAQLILACDQGYSLFVVHQGLVTNENPCVSLDHRPQFNHFKLNTCFDEIRVGQSFSDQGNND